MSIFKRLGHSGEMLSRDTRRERNRDWERERERERYENREREVWTSEEAKALWLGEQRDLSSLVRSVVRLALDREARSGCRVVSLCERALSREQTLYRMWRFTNIFSLFIANVFLIGANYFFFPICRFLSRSIDFVSSIFDCATIFRTPQSGR